jgi:hypothetical protein
MLKDKHFNGFAIAIALPDIYCKQANGWYDGLMHFLGFAKEYYYKSGHAMVLLVNNSGDIFFYDFGRYHAPIGHGRLRELVTDMMLNFEIKAIIKKIKY